MPLTAGAVIYSPVSSLVSFRRDWQAYAVAEFVFGLQRVMGRVHVMRTRVGLLQHDLLLR
jgi:hypothetical protein